MLSVLITGGAGFIGRHVARECLARGHEVTLIDSLVEQVHGGDLPALPGAARLVAADLRDRAALDRALEGVDAVIHLAAEVGVGQSMYEIVRYVGGNDLATATLLEALIGRPVRRLVVASSMSVYGEGLYADARGRRYLSVRRDPARLARGHWTPVSDAGEDLLPLPTDEDKPVDLASIYALTKYAQERQALIFGRAYGVPTLALRLFNVFGPGQALSNPYTGVIANFAARIANGERPLVFEDGEQQRDFVHVADVARAFAAALESEASGEVVNIGSGTAYSVREVAEFLARALGREDLSPDILYKARAGDIRHCVADISRARALLGYAPRQTLEQSLDEIVAWVSGSTAVDRGATMKAELEARGLVS